MNILVFTNENKGFGCFISNTMIIIFVNFLLQRIEHHGITTSQQPQLLKNKTTMMTRLEKDTKLYLLEQQGSQ
jgi:hypothetical protein